MNQINLSEHQVKVQLLAIKDNFIFNDEPLFLDFEQAFQEGVWVPLNQQCPANKILHFNEGHWAVLDEQPSLTTQQISYNATDAVYQANDIRVWQCFLPLPLASRSVFDPQKADRLELCITYPTAVFATNETVSPPVEHATTQFR